MCLVAKWYNQGPVAHGAFDRRCMGRLPQARPFLDGLAAGAVMSGPHTDQP